LFSTTLTTQQQLTKIKPYLQLKIVPYMFLDDKDEKKNALSLALKQRQRKSTRLA
jgi:hypothetical protein